MNSYASRPKLFEGVSIEQWSDWHWQQRHRLRSLDELAAVWNLDDDERAAVVEANDHFRVAVTPHYAALANPADPMDPIRLQCVPSAGELVSYPFELADPLAEEEHMPVPGLTHRYPDRALLYVSHNCPVYCRHCTRKRKVSRPETAASKSELRVALDHIRATPAIRDVILSGGDPLTLSDARLDEILGELRDIPHVEVIRLGTRNPVTLPQRITQELCDVLAKHAPLFIHTHFNHPAELGSDAMTALRRLNAAGGVLGNQMVLLKGVNDSADVVMKLNRQLLVAGCRPYYMLQCDMAEGITHFRTPLKTGLEIMDHLRGRIGGMGVPDFVVDLPGGGGKIELVPEYIESRSPHIHGETIVFRNSKGETFDFVDVTDPTHSA